MKSLRPIWIAVCVTALLVFLIGVVATSRSDSSSSSHGRSRAVVEVYATYYGWYDNTPPGCDTAYSACAKGNGTYQHPITFATDKKEFPVGAILYYPTIEKYLVMGDDCQECDQDWSGKGPNGGPDLRHVDVWIGGQGGDEFDVINCEDALTQGSPSGAPLLTPFILNPPSDLPVSTEPLFDSGDNHCFGGATASASYGRYKNVQSGMCLVDPSDGATSGTTAALAPCNSGAAQDLAFDGAFFVHGKLCLQARGSKPGAAIEFTTCNGNDRQQWAINPNGTIGWIQYSWCIAVVSGGLQLSSCTGKPSDRWVFTSDAAP